jgi:hypothetical protein
MYHIPVNCRLFGEWDAEAFQIWRFDSRLADGLPVSMDLVTETGA